MTGRKGYSKSIKHLSQTIQRKLGAISCFDQKRDELEQALVRLERDPLAQSSKIEELKQELFWLNRRIETKKDELAKATLSLEKKRPPSDEPVPNEPLRIIQLEDLLTETEAELYTSFQKEEEWKEKYLKLRQAYEELQAENRRLKDLPPKPKLHPEKKKEEGKVQNGKQPKNGKKNKKGGSKKGKTKRSNQGLKIHETTILPAPADLPPGFEVLGYKDFVVQDVRLEAYNTLFRIPRIYNRDTKETMKLDFPPGVQGHFGGVLRALVIYLNHQGRVPENKIYTLLKEFGIEMSSGQIHNVLTDNIEGFHKEKADILSAGLKVSSVIQTDDTGARHSGQNGFCNVICNDLFTVYHTTTSKSRLNFLTILSQNRDCYTFNSDAIEYLHRINTPIKWIDLFAQQTNFTLKPLEKFLKRHNVPEKVSQNVLESGLLGSLIENGFNTDLIVHSDGARQFDLFVHCLCWIHAARPLKKIIAASDHQASIISQKLDEFWKFYKKLSEYKLKPTEAAAKRLNKAFDEIFDQKTGLIELNEALKSILNNKSKLLLVLERPEAPIHNNGTETEGREPVVRNKISHTGSEAGKQGRDTFLSLMKTSRKLGVSFWVYLNDRIFSSNLIPNLSFMITQKALSQTPA